MFPARWPVRPEADNVRIGEVDVHHVIGESPLGYADFHLTNSSCISCRASKPSGKARGSLKPIESELETLFHIRGLRHRYHDRRARAIIGHRVWFSAPFGTPFRGCASFVARELVF